MCGEKSYPTPRWHLGGDGDKSWRIWPPLVLLVYKHRQHAWHIFFSYLLDFIFVFQNGQFFFIKLKHAAAAIWNALSLDISITSSSCTHTHSLTQKQECQLCCFHAGQKRKSSVYVIEAVLLLWAVIWWEDNTTLRWKLWNVFISSACSHPTSLCSCSSL